MLSALVTASIFRNNCFLDSLLFGILRMIFNAILTEFFLMPHVLCFRLIFESCNS